MSLPLNKEFSWKKKLHAHLQLARISNSPTVFSNVLAGAVLSGVMYNGVLEGNEATSLLFLMLAMGVLYTAGMYLNDVFDYKIDLKERPKRPLPSGLVDKNTAIALVIIFFFIGLLLLAFVNSGAFISGLLLIGIIIFYDYWHKTNPFGHYVMAMTRVMVYVTAFVAFSDTASSELMISALLLFFYVSGFTFIAKSENKTDFARYWPIIFIILPVIYFGYQLEMAFLPVVLLFLGWSLYSLTFIYRQQKKDIGGGIVRLIAGISLFDAMVLALYEAFWPIMLVFILFGLTRFFQGYIEGS
ncbi:MAG: UbiA family prenyltransferase [Balneolales bacterium]